MALVQYQETLKRELGVVVSQFGVSAANQPLMVWAANLLVCPGLPAEGADETSAAHVNQKTLLREPGVNRLTTACGETY